MKYSGLLARMPYQMHATTCITISNTNKAKTMQATKIQTSERMRDSISSPIFCVRTNRTRRIMRRMRTPRTMLVMFQAATPMITSIQSMSTMKKSRANRDRRYFLATLLGLVTTIPSLEMYPVKKFLMRSKVQNNRGVHAKMMLAAPSCSFKICKGMLMMSDNTRKSPTTSRLIYRKELGLIMYFLQNSLQVPSSLSSEREGKLAASEFNEKSRLI
mmetsp:Transcript_58530/g.178490  ORF Transcript_58530/g.178490 Transcript_58530/m.178490 type:complete len:216 (-) Transcript_58530:648-1295(-)